ncbi:MAG: hypothetical protein ACO1QB_10095 [Verrucomicrobiales bacterium]
MEPQTSLATPVSSAEPEQERESFKVFIGFDTATAEAEAMSTAQYVRSQLADEFDVNLTSWDLAYLGAPRLRERAATEAAAADMIIVSSQENSSGLGFLKPWISKWKDKRKKSGALVALIQGEEQHGKTEIFSLLEKTAQSTQMDFIAKYSRKGS